MNTEAIGAIAIFILLFGSISRRLKKSVITPPMAYDGICLPVLLLFVALAEETERATDASYWLSFSGKQIIFGVVVGIVVGYLANLLITKSLKRNWMNDSFEDLSVLGISILAYAAADIIGGNGFIAAFCAGLTLGNIAPKSTRQKLYEFGEAEGQLLTLISFLLYGAVMIVPSLSQSNWQMWLYAIASLTVARIVGVAISTIGSGLQPISVLFIGWFGSRGIASIIYGLVIVEEDNLSNSDIIFATIVVTVLISIFAHGLTAVPGANWYDDRMNDKQATKGQMSEHKPVPEMAVRLPWRQ